MTELFTTFAPIIFALLLLSLIIYVAVWIFKLRRVVPTNEVHIIRSYGETGGGIQGSSSKSTDMYADARYQHSFNGNKEGIQLNIGVQAKF
jgi:hypothetical protein